MTSEHHGLTTPYSAGHQHMCTLHQVLGAPREEQSASQEEAARAFRGERGASPEVRRSLRRTEGHAQCHHRNVVSEIWTLKTTWVGKLYRCQLL